MTKKFRNVGKSKQKELSLNFPTLLSLFTQDNLEGFNKISISVFSHWLSKSEAITEIDNISLEKCEENNLKLHKSIISLANANECYLVKLKGINKNKISFKELTQPLDENPILIPKHHLSGDKWRFVLVFPEHKAVYFEGSDFTHQLYYKDKSVISNFNSLIEKAGLHVLQQ